MTAKVFLNGKVTLHGGDCLEVLKTLPDCSLDSCVTDPPYHLTSIVKRFGGANATPAQFGTDGAFARASRGFMNAVWDGGDIAFRVELWAEVWRVLKPGGWVAAFSATRTYHRMAVAIEDAGFEIRDDILNMIATDTVAAGFVRSLSPAQAEAFLKLMEESQFGGMAGWAYGSGFPKSHNVSKAIDKHLGAERGTVRVKPRAETSGTMAGSSDTRPWIEAAKERGYHEVANDTPATPQAAAWDGWGTALKPAWEPICLARKPLIGTVAENVLEHGTGALNIDGCRVGTDEMQATASTGVLVSGNGSMAGGNYARVEAGTKSGRWPANIVHDGSDEVVAAFPEVHGAGAAGYSKEREAYEATSMHITGGELFRIGDSGSAARFFYSAKADKLDRIGSKHPTVKPVDLMQWLCRLVTPPGGVVLDPFAGSGSTGEAAWREGFSAILVEREVEYQADIAERMRLADKGPRERKQKAIKQVQDAGPLFGANDNLPVGGGQTDLREVRGSAARVQPPPRASTTATRASSTSDRPNHRSSRAQEVGDAA